MNKLPFIGVTMLCLLLAVPASAGDYHGRHHRHYDRHDGHRHYRKHSHHHRQHHYHHHRRSERNAEYLIGGLVLGAVLNELADNHTRSSTTTTSHTTTVYASPGTRISSSSRAVSNEYLRASDGRCYAVDYRNGDRILTEVHSDACVF